MKRIALILFVALLGASAQAQPARTEISIGYGFLTAQDGAEIGKAFLSIIGSAIGSGIVDAVIGEGTATRLEDDDIMGFGTWKLGVYRQANLRLRYGIIITYSPYEVVYTFDNDVEARDNDNFLTAMFRTDYCWLHRRKVMLYSGGAVGGCYYWSKGTSSWANDETNGAFMFAFQANLLGIRLGGRIAFYSEFGIGFSGLWNGGLSFRF